ncbi:MAG: tyrosine-type recombinase/integrase [Pseudolabrys sp.]
MSVRKRKWTTRRGDEKEAWVVNYTDQQGRRVLKTFRTKKLADNYAADSHIEVREGTHVADSASVTVKEAGDLWLESAEAAQLERTTLEQYRQHLRLHIEPIIGRTKLSQLNAPTIRAFEDRLRKGNETKKKCSPTMIRYVVRSLGALLADAQERGTIVRNPVRELRTRRGKDRHEDRHNGKLKVGVDIPTPDEIKRIIHAAKGHWRPLLLTAIFCGLRASELRGLRWSDVDLTKSELHVRQRADRFNKIGPPKTNAGERTVPLPPMVVNTLREWKLKCPKKDGKLWLCFPNGEGNVEWHTNLVLRGLQPTLVRAAVVNAKGEAKYTGMHALRHFYASWCASIGMTMKAVQTRMGHSNIAVTMDTYTHIFPDAADDTEKLATAERALMT